MKWQEPKEPLSLQKGQVEGRSAVIEEGVRISEGRVVGTEGWTWGESVWG